MTKSNTTSRTAKPKESRAKGPSRRAGSAGGPKASAKPATAPRKAVAKSSVTARKSSSGSNNEDETATDLLMKLLESPLVADLLAVGATAALSAITASRFSRRDGAERKSGNAVKSAGKAAAAAIGRRLKEEYDAIREAAEASQTSGA